MYTAAKLGIGTLATFTHLHKKGMSNICLCLTSYYFQNLGMIITDIVQNVLLKLDIFAKCRRYCFIP